MLGSEKGGAILRDRNIVPFPSTLVSLCLFHPPRSSQRDPVKPKLNHILPLFKTLPGFLSHSEEKPKSAMTMASCVP